MPVYDYKCAEHGLFHELASMDDAALPAPCPQCQQASPRVIMIAPQIVDMAPEKRQAHSRNERAAHEPVVHDAERRAQHRHGPDCGCGSANDPGAKRSKAVLLADGSKIFPSQRPWMISH